MLDVTLKLISNESKKARGQHYTRSLHQNQVVASPVIKEVRVTHTYKIWDISSTHFREFPFVKILIRWENVYVCQGGYYIRCFTKIRVSSLHDTGRFPLSALVQAFHDLIRPRCSPLQKTNGLTIRLLWLKGTWA